MLWAAFDSRRPTWCGRSDAKVGGQPASIRDEHYRERCHQGIGNRPIDGVPNSARGPSRGKNGWEESQAITTEELRDRWIKHWNRTRNRWKHGRGPLAIRTARPSGRPSRERRPSGVGPRSEGGRHHDTSAQFFDFQLSECSRLGHHRRHALELERFEVAIPHAHTRWCPPDLLWRTVVGEVLGKIRSAGSSFHRIPRRPVSRVSTQRPPIRPSRSCSRPRGRRSSPHPEAQRRTRP